MEYTELEELEVAGSLKTTNKPWCLRHMWDHVTPTGKGLEISIRTGTSVLHDWIAFLSWYSINKNIPDANVKIHKIKDKINYGTLGWVKKLKLPVLKSFACPSINLPCNFLAIRPLDDRWSAWFKGDKNVEELWSDAKSETVSTFCDVSNWGNFVMSDWIDTNKDVYEMRFSNNEMTANEEKIADLWKSAFSVYSAIRG